MSLVVFNKNARANITLNYMYSLKNQNGIVAVSGTYIEDNKLKGRIRRDVAYNWTGKPGFVSLTLNPNQ